MSDEVRLEDPNRARRPPRPGSLDRTFAVEPPPDLALLSVTAAGRDRVFVSGAFTEIGGRPRRHVALVGRDGRVDPGFDTSENRTGGNRVLPYRGGALVLDGLGIHRLRSDGVLDEEFERNKSQAGILSNGHGALVLAGDRILFAGNLRPPADPTGPALLILRPDGTVAQTVTRFEGEVHAMDLLAEDQAVLGGWRIKIGELSRRSLVRLDLGGDADPGYAAGGEIDAAVLALTALSGGGLLIGGGFEQVGGRVRRGVAVLGPDGKPTGFDPELACHANAVAMQPGGQVLVAGSFPARRRGVARFLPDGRLERLDVQFGGSDNVQDMALLGNGDRAVIVGGFDTIDGVERRRIARIQTPLASDPTGTGQPLPPEDRPAVGPRR